MTGAARGGRSAAEWFAVMHGPDAEAERAAFETWRRTPGHADAYAALEATWDESRFLANGEIARGRDLSRARRASPRGALLAAGVALFTLLSASLIADHLHWFGPPAVQRKAPVRLAANDTVRIFRLADGSRVTLDRGARLDDASTPAERRFLLLHGRARFEVAHDPARRFVVDAGDGQVVAHGTVFDVGLENRAVRVVLLKGSVEVRDRKKAAPGASPSRFLAPGEEMMVRAGTLGTPTRASADRLAWPEAMIRFDGMPLADAVGLFNRGSRQTVRIESGAPGALRVSGAFRRDDPRGFADALAASFGLEVETTADGNLLLRAPRADGA